VLFLRAFWRTIKKLRRTQTAVLNPTEKGAFYLFLTVCPTRTSGTSKESRMTPFHVGPELGRRKAADVNESPRARPQKWCR